MLILLFLILFSITDTGMLGCILILLYPEPKFMEFILW